MTLFPPKTLRICGVTVEHGLCCRFLHLHDGPHEGRTPRTEVSPRPTDNTWATARYQGNHRGTGTGFDCDGSISDSIKSYAHKLPDGRTWWD